MQILQSHSPRYGDRCAGDFFKVLLKFKMAATDQQQFFCGRKNSETQILQSHSPRYGDVQVTYFQVLLKFLMTTTDQLHFFL